MTQAAFPSPGVVIKDYSSQRQQGAYEGMTLRDYFAAKAMTSELVGGVHMDDFEDVARRAYAMADEMLKERES